MAKVNIVIYCPTSGCRRYNPVHNKICSKCGAKIKSLRQKQYFLDYRVPSGKRVREQVGVHSNQGEARRRAAAVEVRLAQLASAGPGNVLTTLGELSDWYLSLSEVRQKRSYDRDVQTLTNLMRLIDPELHIAKLNRGVIETYRQHRLSERNGRRKATTAKSTVNREVRILNHALNLAVEFEFLHRNPAKGIRMLREQNQRERILEPEEYHLLLKHSFDFPHLRDVIIVAVNTGMRQQEILGLTHGELDWQGKVIRISGARTKSGEGRTIPMFPPVQEALKRQPRGLRTDRVFLYRGRPLKSVKTSFAKTCRLAGVQGFWFHDLRRTFITWMAREGKSERLIMAITGHKTRSAFDRYRRIREDEVMGVRDPGFGHPGKQEDKVVLDSKVDSSKGLVKLDGRKPA